MNEKLQKIYTELGITEEHIAANKLEFCNEPDLKDLEVVEIDFEGKPFVLLASTAKAWREMAAAAAKDGVTLQAFSGFRSLMHQKNLIQKHLINGRSLDEILTVLAIPGFSEHHSGHAIDIYSNDHAVLEETFEKTKAFAWLIQNASKFKFRLSYPRDNSMGIVFEPWHWYYIG